MTMTATYDFSGGFEDCAKVYEGAGVQDGSDGAHVWFEGTWQVTSDDCSTDGALESLWPWWDQSSEEAFVGFEFTSGLAGVDAWWAHSLPVESYDNAKWKMWDMAAKVDDDGFAYYEAFSDGQGYISGSYDVVVEFER